MTRTKRILLTLIILLALGGATGAGYWYFVHSIAEGVATYQTVEEEENVYVRLGMEAYDVIKENYWQEVTDEALSDLFKLSLAKASNNPSVSLATTTRAGVATMFGTAIDGVGDEEQKKALTLQTITVVLYNLGPAGRSQLYTQVDEAALRNRVANINPDKDLYDELGVPSGANTAAVQSAFEARREELSASSSPEAKAELERVSYAHAVLADNESKKMYDEAKIEPTVVSRIYGSNTLYVQIKQIAPTSLKEFIDHIVAKSKETTLSRLIVDFRGNEGGALDFAPYMLGVFMGPNQYAADLFHKGEREVLRTPEQIPRITDLENFEEIVFLVDERTQSTAELTAAIFKRQNLAVIIGNTTKGWGTVENTFPLSTKITEGESYLLYLVHSLTLRDDQQPIEESGVVPHVSVDADDWQTQLSKYVSSAEVRSAVLELFSTQN